jgi:integrase
MQKVLTDALLKGTKTPPAGRVEIADLRCVGLTFRVTSRNARSWSFRFRDPVSSDPGRFTIGRYPDIGLSAARERADELRAEVAEGRNPVDIKRQARVDAPNKTFRALAARYMTEHSERKKRSHARDKTNLDLHVLPLWGARAYLGITRGDVIELVEGVVKAGKHTLANRVQSLISGIFSFAIDAGLRSDNPCTRLKKRGNERAKDRVLSDDEIRSFWLATASPRLSKTSRLALRLALLNGCRIGEIAGMARGELANLNDPERAEWLVPAVRVKQRKEKQGPPRSQLVPLSPMARDIVLELLADIGPDAQHLMPNRARNGYMPAHTLTNAMTGLADVVDLPSWAADRPTAHDLRRTVETRLSSLGIPKEDRDAVLGHVKSDVGSRHYDRYDRAAEKRRALNLWSRALEGILSGRTGTVLPLTRAGARVS